MIQIASNGNATIKNGTFMRIKDLLNCSSGLNHFTERGIADYCKFPGLHSKPLKK